MKHWKRVIDRLLGRTRGEKTEVDFRSMLSDAYALLQSEDYAAARKTLVRAASFRNRIVDAATIKWILGSLEVTWLFQDTYEEQIKFFTEYITRYPGDAAAYCARASGLWYSGRLHEAVSDYTRALEQDPTDVLPRSGRGQVLVELGENMKALDDLDMALRMIEDIPRSDATWVEWCNGNAAFAHRGRGVALAQLGQTPEAMTEFNNSINLAPENAWVYFSRAEVYEHLKDQENALSDYRMALKRAGPKLSLRQNRQANERVQYLSREGIS